MFLTWHVAGFWWGYIRKVRPLLVKNHAVIGDRYSYDLFLDPVRFRLQLPNWICRWAAKFTPQPDLIVALLADPEAIHRRKPELSEVEISEYQARLRELARGKMHMVEIAADEGPDETVVLVKRAMLNAFFAG